MSLSDDCEGCATRHCSSCIVATEFKRKRFDEREERQRSQFDALYAKVLKETNLTELQLDNLIESSVKFYVVGHTREGSLSTLERVAGALGVL